MKQLAQYQDGRLELQDVPMPAAPPGGILVRTTHSVISVGTEKMKVAQARMNLLQKARARPDQVRKVLDTARTLGWQTALEKVRSRLESPTPLGYSATGIVVAVDPGNGRFRVGDRVACAGAECAHHAEFVAVPDLLAAPVPDGVPGWMAAYATVTSIALQAVRQAAPAIGSRAVVIGQGLIGVLLTNLLEASGVRVMAVDLLASRAELCRDLGAERFCSAEAESPVAAALAWSGGVGVDVVFLCTATSANGPTEQAIAMLRDRGCVVIVGNTRADLDWKTCYEKEIEVRYSRSYGPGRYDPSYEWRGVDYPIGYVRWTENRNLEACLAFMAAKKLRLDRITTRRAPFAEAPVVYETLALADNRDLGIVLEYEEGEIATVPTQPSGLTSAPSNLSPAPPTPRQLHVIGAGNFARTMLLPFVGSGLPLGAVINQTALSAQHIRKKFGFSSVQTDVATFWAAHPGDATIIATRHHLHAPQVLAALAANQHVFVEKPLCLTENELFEIDQAVAASGGSVMIGFNRRFAPATTALLAALASIPGPRSITILVNAGRLDPSHWYANYDESGGRIIGEACHFFDYALAASGSRAVAVTAAPSGAASARLPFPDGIAAQIEFADGGVAQIVYSGEGDPSFPKETIQVVATGFAGRIENFLQLTLHRGRRAQSQRFRSKGHREEMDRWMGFLAGGKPHPLPYTTGRASMQLTFAAMQSLRERRRITLTDAPA